MSYGIIDQSALTAVGNAIRSKAGTSAPIAVADLAQAIIDLPSGGQESYLNARNTVCMSGVVSGSWLAVDPHAFYSNTNITAVYLPSCSTVYDRGFFYCSGISVVSLPLCKEIQANAFFRCVNLESVYIGTSNCKLTSNTNFGLTPMSASSFIGHFGSIYVPSDYVNYYKTAANWSAYSSRITGY